MTCMGRPPLAVGTAGQVRTFRGPNGGWIARAKYRDFDGVTRVVQKAGRTEGAARQNLAIAIRDRSHLPKGAALTPETKVTALAERWLDDIRQSDLSPTTIRQYEDRTTKQVIPALGNLRLREVTVGVVDRHLATVKAHHGPALAKVTRSVLSNMFSLACRHDAMESNPTRYVSRISTKPKRRPTALPAPSIRQLVAYLTYDQLAVTHDLPDLVRGLAATGCRIGELCAITWDCVNFDEGTVEIKGTVIRVRGQERGKGLVIKPSTKSKAGNRVLELPSWCADMFEARKVAATTNLVFPSPLGHIRDASNTRRALQQALARVGYGDEALTTHTFRRSVASLMDSAGLEARRGADQLGHSSPVVTMSSYWGRERRATGAAAVLESLGS